MANRCPACGHLTTTGWANWIAVHLLLLWLINLMIGDPLGNYITEEIEANKMRHQAIERYERSREQQREIDRLYQERLKKRDQ